MLESSAFRVLNRWEHLTLARPEIELANHVARSAEVLLDCNLAART